MLLNDFVNAGIAAGVLTEAAVRAHVDEMNGSQDGARIASTLVQAGKLTSYQAEMILKGSGPNLVLGNYVLLDRLGQGGMGDVFKARHRRMDRIVALKTISPHFLRVPDALDRFYREAKAAARLSHPNIVTAHDADEAGGVHFLVMEYVAGCDLDVVVTLQGALAPGLAARLALDAARGLEYAHSKGIVHRDIKPANLMFTLEGSVKILDMGLARIEQGEGERFTRTNCGFGSVDYMPPEQADSARLADERSDIYSLGCTLYKLLTGRVIYEHSSVLKTIAAHRDATIPTIDLRHPQGEELHALYQRMVAKSPEDRPQSMSEVAAALAKIGGDADLAPLTSAVKAIHDRPSWLVDPEAKTIRPGEPVTPMPLGSGPPQRVDPNRKTDGTSGSKTIPTHLPARPDSKVPPAGGSSKTLNPAPTPAAGASPSSMAWRTAPNLPERDSDFSLVEESSSGAGMGSTKAVRQPARPSQHPATVPVVSTAPEDSTTVSEGQDWLDDVVSESKEVEPRRRKSAKLDPMLIAAGAGLAGFTFLLLILWMFLGGSELPKQVAQETKATMGDTAKQTDTSTHSPTSNPVSTSPVSNPPVTRPGPPVTNPDLEPKKLEPPVVPPTKGTDPVDPGKTAPEKTQPEKTPTPPEKTPAEPADLMKAVDIKNDSIGKSWDKQAAGLVARPTVAPHLHPPAQSVFGLQLPFTPPASYQLKVTVEHLAGEKGPMIIAFPEGNSWRLVVIDEPPPPEPPPGKLPEKKRPPPKAGFPPPPPPGGPAGKPEPPPRLRDPPDLWAKTGKMPLVFKVRDNGQSIECNDERITAAGPNEPLREMTDLATRRAVLLLSLGNYRVSGLEWEPLP